MKIASASRTTSRREVARTTAGSRMVVTIIGSAERLSRALEIRWGGSNREEHVLRTSKIGAGEQIGSTDLAVVHSGSRPHDRASAQNLERTDEACPHCFRPACDRRDPLSL